MSSRFQAASSGGKGYVAIHRRRQRKWGHPRPTRHASLLLWWLRSRAPVRSLRVRPYHFGPLRRCTERFWRLKPKDFPSDVGHGLAIGSRAHPCEQATRLEVRLKLSAGEEDAVRLLLHKAFPHLLRGGGNVEDIFQWCLMGHDCS